MKKTSKRLLAMLLALIMAFSVSSIFMVSASAIDPTPTKLSTVLAGITTQCSITVKPLKGSLDIQGFKIPGTVNIYIKDKNIAAAATILGMIKVKALLTADNGFVMLPFFRVFAKMSVTDLFTKLGINDDKLIDFDNDPNNGNGITIGALRADPIAGVKKLYNENLVRTATAEGVSFNGGTFSTETYSAKNETTPLFTCYFSSDGSLQYIKVITTDVTMQDNLTFKVDIVPTVANTKVFNEPKFFYFDLTSYIIDGLMNLLK